MVCEKCRKIIPNDSDFCPHCGKKQEKTYTEKEYVVNDNNKNISSELSTKRKIIGIAITVIILLVLGIGIHHYKQEQTNPSDKVSTQTENVTTEKSSNSNTGKDIIVDHHSIALLWSKHIKETVNAIPMGEEKNLGDVFLKIPQEAHVTLSENKKIIVEAEPSIKYGVNIVNMQKEYPKELSQFSIKQVTDFANEFMYIYHRDRALADFLKGEVTVYNKNKVYMLRLEAFVPDAYDIRYKTSFYVMYHEGICYAVEINEGMKEHDNTLAYPVSYAFLDNIRYR